MALQDVNTFLSQSHPLKYLIGAFALASYVSFSPALGKISILISIISLKCCTLRALLCNAAAAGLYFSAAVDSLQLLQVDAGFLCLISSGDVFYSTFIFCRVVPGLSYSDLADLRKQGPTVLSEILSMYFSKRVYKILILPLWFLEL